MIPVPQSMPPSTHVKAVRTEGTIEGCGASVDAPWRYAALAQVWNLETSGANVPGQGDFRIAEATSSRARQVLAQIQASELPTPEVVPISGGGIAVSWRVGAREILVSVFPDEVVYLKIENNQIVDEPEGESPETRYTNGLNWLLKRAA